MIPDFESDSFFHDKIELAAFYRDDVLPFLNSTDTINFKTSIKGQPILQYENFTYHKNRSSGNKIYWRCAHAKRLKCRARLITIGSNMSTCSNTINAHNHIPIQRLQYGTGVNIGRRKIK